jgi:hypothetical protein
LKSVIKHKNINDNIEDGLPFLLFLYNDEIIFGNLRPNVVLANNDLALHATRSKIEFTCIKVVTVTFLALCVIDGLNDGVSNSKKGFSLFILFLFFQLLSFVDSTAPLQS